MEGESLHSFDISIEDSDTSSNEEGSDQQEAPSESAVSPVQGEKEIVLYPIAPKARARTDEQVDVKISPAFQILDQVFGRYLTLLLNTVFPHKE